MILTNATKSQLTPTERQLFITFANNFINLPVKDIIEHFWNWVPVTNFDIIPRAKNNEKLAMLLINELYHQCKNANVDFDFRSPTPGSENIAFDTLARKTNIVVASAVLERFYTITIPASNLMRVFSFIARGNIKFALKRFFLFTEFQADILKNHTRAVKALLDAVSNNRIEQ